LIYLQLRSLFQQVLCRTQGSLERGQATEGTFRARDDLLEFMQGGVRFTSAAFQWLDAFGTPVHIDLAPGATLNSTVTVRESAALNFNAPFQLFYAGQLVLDFAGRAPGQPQLTIAPIPLELNFDMVLVGATADRSFTVLNSGEGTLTGSATTTAPFGIVGGGTFTLAAGQSQTITVRVSPSESGAFLGTVNVISNRGNASVGLIGTGTGTGPQLDVLSRVLNFDPINVGESQDITTTIVNVGTGTLRGSATTTAPFSIVEGGTFNVGAGPGQSQRLTVRFSPTAEGPVTGSVSVTSNGGDISVSLTGTGS
jgi:hypothetical protein